MGRGQADAKAKRTSARIPSEVILAQSLASHHRPMLYFSISAKWFASRRSIDVQSTAPA